MNRPRRSRRWPSGRAIAAAASIALVAPARASDQPAPPTPGGFVERLLADVRVRIDAAIVARAPTLAPPKQLAIKWRLGKLGALELGAPIVTLAGGDLDGDGKGELYAVTTRGVIAIGLGADMKPRELSRVAFTGALAARSPRDVVGAAVADGAALIASVSTWARGWRIGWRKGTLVADPGEAGFVLCPGQLAQLAPGRNYFGDAQAAIYGVRCTSRLVDNDGYPLRARAQLSIANKLDIAVERCAAIDFKCHPAARHEYANAGIAFDVADVDRDGRPEVIYAAAGAPGDPDVLKVVSLGDDVKRQAKVDKRFTSGGIGGVAFADLDGDGAGEAIAAIRLAGTTRIELWRIE